MRKAGWILAVALLLVTGLAGLANGVTELGDWSTKLQTTVTLGVALYGFLGLVGGVGLARRRPWSVTVSAAWAIVLTYVATIASFAYHDPTLARRETLTGTIAAGVSTALIGLFVVWAARYSTRAPLPPRPPAGHIPSP